MVGRGLCSCCSASRPEIIRFVSVLMKSGRCAASIPCSLPPSGEWFVRIMTSKDGFVFGEYRRHMKTIGYLGQIDRLFGAPATTRKLEYYRGHRANFERRGEKPISAIGEMRGYPLSSLPSCQRPCGPPTGSWGHFFPTARLPKNVLERSISLEPALIVGWNALQLPVTGCPSPLE
jgi:hypothetical protein